MTRFALLLSTSLLAGAPLTAAAQPAEASQDRFPAGAESRQAAGLPTAAQVLGSTRRAVGYGRLAALRHGFTITERDEAANQVRSLHFGTRRGEVRDADFGFDGGFAWQHDARRGMAIPASQRQREKLIWPLWVRGHWWLDPRSGIRVAVDPHGSDARTVALSLTLEDGLVPASLFIDRATWLPVRLVVPYERGPFVQSYSDYRAWRGVKVPFAVDTVYRGETRRRAQAIAEIDDRQAFAAPALPGDHRFEPSVAADLVTTAGAPFSTGVPGHHYVRATADDRQTGWWHFDSGADGMIIDDAVADALGLPVIGQTRSMGADGNVREGTIRRGRSFTLGRIRIENPVFLALDLSANNAPPGERRMGTIGYDLFARSVVEFADGGADIRVCNPANYRLPRGGRWQRLSHIDLTPAVPGVVEDRARGLFQVDTGAAGTVDFYAPFHQRHRFLETRQTEELRSLGAGGSFAVRRGQLARFDFAGIRHRDLEVTFRTGGIGREGGAGVIGRILLAPFTTVFDYSNRRIAFVPLAHGRGSCG